MRYVVDYRIRCGSAELAEAAQACVDNTVVALGQFGKVVDLGTDHVDGVRDVEDEVSGTFFIDTSYAFEPGWVDKSFEALVSMGMGHNTVMIEANTHETKEEATA